MGIGIQICGLNGSGKTTVGKALAEKLGFIFIDAEDLFFDKTDRYTSPRSRIEAETLLRDKLSGEENFVLASVKGDYGEDIVSRYHCVIWVQAPKEVRLQRIYDRSFQKFSEKMLPGGALFEEEQAFFRLAASREEEYISKWVSTLRCPVLMLDGTNPLEENLRLMIDSLHLQLKNSDL